MQGLRQKVYSMLRKSENFFKTDMVYLAKGGFWLSFAQGMSMLSGFFMSLAFANLFPKEAFGTYKFILSTVAILGAFSLTGLSTSIMQSVARGFSSSLRKGFRINLKWSAGIFLGGLGLSIYYFLNGNLILSYCFLLAGLVSPMISSANLYASYLLGKKDFRKNSFYSVIRNTVPAAVMILTLFIFPSLPVIITTYFLAAAVVSLFLYYKTSSRAEEGQREDPELLSYGGHLSAMDVIGNIVSFLDKILVFHYLGAAPLAIYAFAIAPIEQLQGGKKIISSLIQPKFTGRSFEEIQRSAPHKALMLTIYALSLAGVYVLLVPYFYKFLYPQYLDSIIYSQVYSLTLLAISGTVFNEALIAHKKKRELYLYRTILPIVQITLFLILLPMFGLMGLIITHVITRSFSTALGYYFVTHPFKTAVSS